LGNRRRRSRQIALFYRVKPPPPPNRLTLFQGGFDGAQSRHTGGAENRDFLHTVRRKTTAGRPPMIDVPTPKETAAAVADKSREEEVDDGPTIKRY